MKTRHAISIVATLMMGLTACSSDKKGTTGGDDAGATGSADSEFKACLAKVQKTCVVSELDTAEKMGTPCGGSTMIPIPLTDGSTYGPKTIDEVALITVQIPGYETGADPTETQTTSQGVTAFDVLFWNGKDWEPVSAGMIKGNSLAWKRVRFPFSPVTTSKIRVVVNVGFNSTDGIARIVELEAWGKAPKKFGGT